ADDVASRRLFVGDPLSQGDPSSRHRRTAQGRREDARHAGRGFFRAQRASTRGRADGAHLMLAQVKKPEDSKYPWDYYQIPTRIPGEQAFGPPNPACPLVKGWAPPKRLRSVICGYRDSAVSRAQPRLCRMHKIQEAQTRPRAAMTRVRSRWR